MNTIFGPVPSRRLGRSLGIDVIAPKTCTYDCVYCESGRTTCLTLEKQRDVSVEDVLKDLEGFFERHPGGADVLTFSSAGEPTLYGELGPLIQGIKERFPHLPLVVLTNGSLLWDAGVRRSLLMADRVVPSMDAVTDPVFRKINRPHSRLDMTAIIEGMVALRREYSGQLHLEVLLVKGVNDHPEELQKIREVTERIAPDRIELNTVVRPPAYGYVKGLNDEEMNAAAQIFPAGVTEIIGCFSGCTSGFRDENLESRVRELLLRRPCGLEEMAASLGVKGEDLHGVLDRMCRATRLGRYTFDGREYYCAGGRQ